MEAAERSASELGSKWKETHCGLKAKDHMDMEFLRVIDAFQTSINETLKVMNHPIKGKIGIPEPHPHPPIKETLMVYKYRAYKNKDQART